MFQSEINHGFDVFQFIAGIIIRAVSNFHAVKIKSIVNHFLHDRLDSEFAAAIKVIASPLEIAEELAW